jgi:LEA14-like dessication related protein
MKKSLPALGLPVLLLSLTCTSPPPPPPPPEPPAAGLVFERIEAERIDRIVVCYRFFAENPGPLPVDIEILGWEGELNGVDAGPRWAALTLDGNAAEGRRLLAQPGESIEKTFALELDLSKIPEVFEVPAGGEYLARLGVDFAYRSVHAPARPARVRADAVFPRIQEPEFTITAIAIMQAELINTRFRVSLRIDNPNGFPLALSSLGYELYGEGRFWADGEEREVLAIPALGSRETSLFLMMNFINMKRQLLDDVIAMRLVRYRFTGEVEVGTGVSWLPSFHMGFDRSGNSVVLK